MENKISKVDASAMNSLYSGELESTFKDKTAAEGDPQAFKDHKEYMDTLEEVLKEDKKEAWDPNDVHLD
jgi:hypothetical protein